ncbi:LCP family protein [uncultured Ruminococcus sp.]|uniref:LCP family glycopolymer transferase n=1 Tax=uncultured Ruminococcus sp. TaxID=165186 RepID=UPI002631FD1E|nr:LCP family protein [uncultured Ruminococcus sp.]
MANRKSGSIAVPFLATIFIGLIVIGGIAAGLYKYLGFGKQEKPSEPIPRTSGMVTDADNHTVLLVLDVPEKNAPPTFVLMRSRPVKKELVFIGIPSNSIALVGDTQESIMNSYQSSGPAGAADFVEKVFDVEVDRYMKFDSAAFKKISDIFGGVTYAVNADIAGFKNDGSQQYLNSDQVEMFVTYMMFQGGEYERTLIATDVLKSMVNQADGKRIADSFDNNFNTIINMVESDVKSADYKEHKTAIKNMFENGSSIAVALSVDGTNAGDDFIPSSGFIANIKDQYFKEK